jgi:hypothetical protein
VLRHCLKALAFAFRAGPGDVGGHGTGEVFHVAAGVAAPAQAADFFAGSEPRDDAVESVAHLLECFAERLQGRFVDHGLPMRLSKKSARKFCPQIGKPGRRFASVAAQISTEKKIQNLCPSVKSVD